MFVSLSDFVLFYFLSGALKPGGRRGSPWRQARHVREVAGITLYGAIILWCAYLRNAEAKGAARALQRKESCWEGGRESDNVVVWEPRDRGTVSHTDVVHFLSYNGVN